MSSRTGLGFHRCVRSRSRDCLGTGVGPGDSALLLHGGPGLSDYMGPLAEELDGLFETIRYTQRGTPPSTSGPPYTVETHVEDAVAILDHFELEHALGDRAFLGGHLALHLAVAHPDRISGLICINTLGAHEDGLAEFGVNLRTRIPAEDAERADTLEGTERLALLWPGYFADPRTRRRCRTGKCGSEANARDLLLDPRPLRGGNARDRPAEAGVARAVHPRRG